MTSIIMDFVGLVSFKKALSKTESKVNVIVGGRFGFFSDRRIHDEQAVT